MISILVVAAALAAAAPSDSRPVWSSDGTRIAFTRTTPSGAYLTVARADGTHLRRLAPIIDGTAPTWSPDSRSVVFQRGSNRAGDGPIFTIRVDGTRLRRVAVGHSPDWSPDGTTIALGHGRRLETVLPDGSGRRVVAGVRTLLGLSWSPDSTRLAFAVWPLRARPQLDVVDIRSRDSKQIGNGYLPAWSPDGQTIAFSRGGCLGVVHATGSSEEPYCDSFYGWVFQASWSPDSSSFVFCGKRLAPYLRAWPSSRVLGDGCDPQWSPDGSRIAFDRRDTPTSKRTQIYTMKPDGSDVRALFSGP